MQLLTLPYEFCSVSIIRLRRMALSHFAVAQEMHFRYEIICDSWMLPFFPERQASRLVCMRATGWLQHVLIITLSPTSASRRFNDAHVKVVRCKKMAFDDRIYGYRSLQVVLFFKGHKVTQQMLYSLSLVSSCLPVCRHVPLIGSILVKI